MTQREESAVAHAESEGNNGNAETSFLAGYSACEKRVLELLRSKKAVHGFVDKEKGPIQLGRGHIGPTLMGANLWADWLEKELSK